MCGEMQNTLNSIDSTIIRFRSEHENNDEQSFFDTIITQEDRNIDVYRIPTHTDTLTTFHTMKTIKV